MAAEFTSEACVELSRATLHLEVVAYALRAPCRDDMNNASWIFLEVIVIEFGDAQSWKRDLIELIVCDENVIRMHFVRD